MSVQLNINQPKEPKTRNKGIIRAIYVPTLVGIPAKAINKRVLNFMKKSSLISQKDSIELSNAAQEGLKQTGLFDKGVKVYKIKENSILSDLTKRLKNYIFNLFKRKPKTGSTTDFIDILKEALIFSEGDKKALNALTEELRLNKEMAKFEQKESCESLTELIVKLQAMVFKEGNNACYLPYTNKIITPDKSLQTSVFHEMGHALNNNGGSILKNLQKCRPLALIAPSVILMISLFNKRKTTDKPKENDSKIQKGADFVKKNASVLTGLSFLPMFLEEGIASLRGQKIAKNLIKDEKLSKELFKKIKLTNIAGFSTYLLSGIITAVAIYLSIKAKDAIQKKYEIKKMQKYKNQVQTNELKAHQG